MKSVNVRYNEHQIIQIHDITTNELIKQRANNLAKVPPKHISKTRGLSKTHSGQREKL